MCMATELITFKADSKFIKEVDKAVKELGYHSRTEMIRQSLRKNVDEAALKKTMAELAHLKGAAKKHITEEEYERVRQQVFEEFAKNDR